MDKSRCTTMHTLLLYFLIAVSQGVFAQTPTAAVGVAETVYLGPFTGVDAPLHPANKSPHRANYYGTDLGWSYEHDGKLHFLFGDTMGSEDFVGIDAGTDGHQDDVFGTINLSVWPDAARIARDNIPYLKLAQEPDSPHLRVMDTGHAMDGLKTPEGGFSNGQREFAVFILSKPRGCTTHSDCGGLVCDNALGYIGNPYFEETGLTQACFDGTPGCNDDTMIDAEGSAVAGSGLCVDETSSYWDDTPAGRINGTATKMRIGARNPDDPGRYAVLSDWLTNKFINTAVRTVQDFAPENGPGHEKQDYTPASSSGGNRRVFLWGRPGFMGIGAKGRSLGLYFGYVDMPTDESSLWEVRYFTGTDADGTPRFSSNETEAAALDLDATRAGVQPEELHDIVQHMSIVWIDHLKKWVMFYGGGMTRTDMGNPALGECGFLRVFAGPDCGAIVIGDGAIRMRTADNPWGPWTPPREVLAAGNPTEPGSGQFGPGGALHHPQCGAPTCSPRSPFPIFSENEHGFFYGVNIIEQWMKPVGDGVDVIWNASTWNPYRVALFRTRLTNEPQ